MCMTESHFTIQKKLTQHCKSTINFLKKEKKIKIIKYFYARVGVCM